jgi:hypothetical protein
LDHYQADLDNIHLVSESKTTIASEHNANSVFTGEYVPLNTFDDLSDRGVTTDPDFTKCYRIVFQPSLAEMKDEIARLLSHWVTLTTTLTTLSSSDYFRYYVSLANEAALEADATIASWKKHISRSQKDDGTATRLSDIYLQLFCDDAKSCEIELINKGVAFEARSVNGLHGEPVEALSIHSFCDELGEEIGVHLLVNDFDDVRGALKQDAQGRSPRGDFEAVKRLIEA